MKKKLLKKKPPTVLFFIYFSTLFWNVMGIIVVSGTSE